MTTKYQVTYPLISQDAKRTFETRAEAEAFASERRQPTPYGTIHSWQRVKIEEIQTEN